MQLVRKHECRRSTVLQITLRRDGAEQRPGLPVFDGVFGLGDLGDLVEPWRCPDDHPSFIGRERSLILGSGRRNDLPALNPFVAKGMEQAQPGADRRLAGATRHHREHRLHLALAGGIRRSVYPPHDPFPERRQVELAALRFRMPQGAQEFDRTLSAPGRIRNSGAAKDPIRTERHHRLPLPALDQKDRAANVLPASGRVRRQGGPRSRSSST